MSDAKFCGGCGKPLEPNSKFCGVCGHPVGVTPSPSNPPMTVVPPTGPPAAATPIGSPFPRGASVGPVRAATPTQTGDASYATAPDPAPGVPGFGDHSAPPARFGAFGAANAGKGLAYVAGGVAVFIVCVVIQAASGSSMFSTSYPGDVSAIEDILINATFYPGWALTIGLVVTGIRSMVASSTRSRRSGG